MRSDLPRRIRRDSGFEPALAARVSGLGSCDTVYLGFPIGGETAPPDDQAVRDTWGCGLGNSLSVLASHAPRAKMRASFVMEANPERSTMNPVNEWLDETA